MSDHIFVSRKLVVEEEEELEEKMAEQTEGVMITWYVALVYDRLRRRSRRFESYSRLTVTNR